MLASEIVMYVRRAIADKVAMAISYTDADGVESARVCLPYYLMEDHEKQIYLHGIANLREEKGNAKRTFRADRIKGLHLGDIAMTQEHITDLAYIYGLVKPPFGRCLAAQKIDRRR